MTQTLNGDLFIGRYQLANDVKIFKSTNDGLDWSIVYTEVGGNQHVHGMATDPYHVPEAIYAGLDAGANPLGSKTIKSVDGGGTWTPLVGTPANAEVNSMYADPSGYRLFGGECAILGGYSIYKTTDDINFYPVLDTGENVYAFQKINGALWANGLANNGNVYPKLYRSTDEGETWQAVYYMPAWTGAGTGNGFRYFSRPIQPTGASEDQIMAGLPNYYTYSPPARIFEGGDHHQALVAVRIDGLPAGGTTVKIKGGFTVRNPNIKLLGTPAIAGTIFSLPLNEGFGTRVKEIISGDTYPIKTPAWVEGGRRLAWIYPFQKKQSDKKALYFKEAGAIDTRHIDMTGGATINFWLNPVGAGVTGIPYTTHLLFALDGYGVDPLFFALTNNVYLDIVGRGSTASQMTMNYPSYPDQWQMLTVKLRSNGGLDFYTNGVLRRSYAASTIDPAILSGFLTIGGLNRYEENLYAITGLSIKMQYFDIFAGELSNADILSLYENGRIV
jgi:hypothetical protein